MTSLPSPPAPRFKVGDQVDVVGPGGHRGKEGVLTEVVATSGGYVYRYRVRFPDGSSASFFGFELSEKE